MDAIGRLACVTVRDFVNPVLVGAIASGLKTAIETIGVSISR